MKLQLSWKLGLIHLPLLVLVLLTADVYTFLAYRRDYLQAAFEQLEALARLAESRPPAKYDPPELKEWAAWISQSGARMTIVARDGTVLADSSEPPEVMENHAGRPEIRAALESGRGTAVRYSDTLRRYLVYLAVRYETHLGTPPLVIRLSVPLNRLEAALAGFRRGLWLASLIILMFASWVSLLFFRALARRIERLKQFSRRVAAGDFRPLPVDRKEDELSDLAGTLNETAVRLEGTIRALTEETGTTIDIDDALMHKAMRLS